MTTPLPMPPKYGPPKSKKKKTPAPGTVGSGGGGGGGGASAPKAPAVTKTGPTTSTAPPPPGGLFANMLNKVGVDPINRVYDNLDSMAQESASGGGGSSGGGSSRRRSGGGGGGGGGAPAAPEIPPFVDPYAQLRSTLQGMYLGNGVDNPGVQSYLGKLTQDAAARTSQYSADAANQSKQAGAQIAANLAQSEAARKAAVAAQMNDLIAQGGQAQAGRLAAVDAQGQAQMAGQSQQAAGLTGRMAEIFGQQSADRLAGVQNTGQYAQGQAATNYQKMSGQVDMATAQAKAAYDQMVAAAASGGGGGGGGGGRRGGGGGGGSGSSGLGSYQDTQTRTLTDNQTNSMTDEDVAAMAQADVWNGLSASDKAAVQAIQTYAVFPELAQAQGVDLKKISQSNPSAFNYWMQVQGNQFGYPYSKSTSTNYQQQYNRDSSVQTSKYTSPKVKGGPPPAGGTATRPGRIPRF